MMRFTFTFKHPDGVLAMTGECPDDGLMEAFDDMINAAEKQVTGPLALIRTRVSVIHPGTGA
jgi:hypothetical protein